MAHKSWLPLESNPAVMTDYLGKLGLDTKRWQFHDVLGLDEELLALVPQPVKAVLLLFPITPASEAAKAAQEERLAREGQTMSPSVWFMRQTVGNACGTVGLVHAALNNAAAVAPPPASFLATFAAKTAALDAIARAAALGEDEALDSAHASAAAEGQSAQPDSVDTHFICFVSVDGGLYELDGRKPAPVHHGACSEAELLSRAAGVVGLEFLPHAGDSLSFSLIAMGPAEA